MVREIKKSLPKGKQAYTVSFRHPVVKDKAGKNGLKIHRSLSTRDPSEADALVQQLQTLVNEEKWWSSNKKDEASEVFNPVVVHAFYDYMENESTNSMLWDALYNHWSKFNLYLPVTVLAENDGFYLRYNVLENNIVKSVWSVKYPYQFRTEDYVVNFHLDDTVQFITPEDAFTGVYNKLLEVYTEDNMESAEAYAAFKSVYEKSVLYKNSSQDYLDVKQNAIAECIVKYMQYYVQQNNIIAQEYGITYSFNLPTSAKSDLARAVTDLSLVTVFQGYSNVLNSDKYYSKMTVAGARAYKGTAFYVRTSKTGIKYYHTENCEVDGTSKESVYYTHESAASTGAFPCPYCNP